MGNGQGHRQLREYHDSLVRQEYQFEELKLCKLSWEHIRTLEFGVLVEISLKFWQIKLAK